MATFFVGGYCIPVIETPVQNASQPLIYAVVLPYQPDGSAEESPDRNTENATSVPEEDEIMETANNIVFRPLFRYRQVQEKKRRVSARRRNYSRRNAQKRTAKPKYSYSYYRPSNNYYRPRYPSYYPKYYTNAQFPTLI